MVININDLHKSMTWDRIKNKLIGTKGLISIGISDITATGISSIFWFYFASIVETEQFGQIHYFLGIAGMSYLIALFGVQSVITVYVSKNLKLEGTIYFLSLITGSVASFIVFFIIHRLDVSLLMLGLIINDLAIGYLLGKKLYVKYGWYVITQKIFNLIICIGLYYIAGTDGILYGFFISYLIFLPIIFKVFRDSKINLALLKPRLGFIMNNFIMNLAGVFRNHLDKLIIGPILGFSILGNYALAVQIFLVLMTFSNVVTKYTLPEYASGNSNKKLTKITIFMSVVIAILGFTILPLVIPIFLPKFLETVDLIKIMSFGVIVATLGQIYSNKILSTEKSKHVVIGRWISASVMIVGIFSLSSVFGAIGLAISFVLSTTFYAVYLIITYSRMK